MRIPFAVQYARERSAPLSSQRVLNLFAHEAPKGSKTPVALYSTPGLNPMGPEIDTSPTRGLALAHGFLFVVAGQTLYRVDNAGNKTLIGTVPGDGPVFMETNDAGQIMIVTAGNKGYIATVATVEEITDPEFPGASSVAHLDGYFIVPAPDSQQFFISELRNGLAWDALDFASAEGTSTHLRRVFADHREVWFFSEDATEVWYNSGAADFPFERVNGASITKGIRGKHSAVSLDNSIFWLANDNIVYRANGYTPVRVSTHAIEFLISEMPNKDEARAFGYTDEGHAFYVLTFPGQATIVYDVATGLWHERQTMGRMDWAVTGYVHAFDRHITGGFTDGHIYAIERARLTENGQSIKRQAVTPTIFAETERFTTSRIQVDFEVGTGAKRTVVDNLLIWTETFDNGAWLKFDASITANAAVAPDGSMTADKLVEAATTANHTTRQNVTKAASPITYVWSVYVKAAERTFVYIEIADSTNLNSAKASFNLATGAVDASGTNGTGFTLVGASVVAAGNGWHRCVVIGTTNSDTEVRARIFHYNGTTTNYAGDGTSGIYIWGADLKQATALTDYVANAAVSGRQIDIEPQAMLDWSDDGGKTWAHERWASIGKIGKYNHRAQWRRLGQSRERVYRVTVTDPVVTTVLGMFGDIEGGKI